MSIDEDLKAAYELKERYRYFNSTCIINENNLDDVREELLDFIFQFRNSSFDSFRTFGRLLSNWNEYILNSFYMVGKKRISNGPIEGMNSKIKTIIKVANGMKDFERFRNRCMFSLNRNTPIK